MGPLLPPWMGDKAARRVRNARSGRQERLRASEIGGRVQAGSGSSWRAPQDVVSAEKLEQVKYTDKASFVLKSSELHKVMQDALDLGRSPQMLVDFTSHGLRAVITIERIP